MNRSILKASALTALLLVVPACSSSGEETETADSELSQQSDRSSSDQPESFRNPAAPLEGDPTEGTQPNLAPHQAQTDVRE